jgi:hypothetical protein
MPARFCGIPEQIRWVKEILKTRDGVMKKVEERRCSCCRRHISELKPFDHTGELLVKRERWNGMRFASWECRDCIVLGNEQYFDKRLYIKFRSMPPLRDEEINELEREANLESVLEDLPEDEKGENWRGQRPSFRELKERSKRGRKRMIRLEK